MNQNNGVTDFQLKLQEAEIYHSMGLLNEALDNYRQAFSCSTDQDQKDHKIIEHKISQVQKEIADRKESGYKMTSAEHISVLHNSMPVDDDFGTILDKAKVLKELGLFSEAAVEYEKLLKQINSKLEFSKNNQLHSTILHDYLTCLIEKGSLHEAVKRANKEISQNGLGDHDYVQILLWLGIEMEKRNQHELAKDLYQSAIKIDPNNKEIQDKIKSLQTKISFSSRYDYLIEENLVAAEQLKEAFTISKKLKKSVEFVLIDRFKIDKKQIGKSLALFYGCPFRSFDSEMPVPFEVVSKFKKIYLLHYMWVPLGWDKSGIEVLLDDPKDLQKTDHILALFGNQKITLSVGIREDVEQFIEYFFDSKAEEPENEESDYFDDFIPDVSFEEEQEFEEDIVAVDEDSSQVVKFVDQILITAFRNNVSDIHVEPSPITRKTTIRFRSDGVCHEYIQIPNSMAPAVISRLKILADLDIAEKRLPQDGKIKIKRKGIPEFELRLSTMPTAGRFEDAVLRILTRVDTIELDDIGLNERNLKVVKKIMNRPYGMILCVGPTGSGKTTTLHASLAYINKPEVKIWTAEDPVEITQAGLRQVQVKPKIGLDFARVMRGFLRLDPDVIMIGEMRDKETASIAIEASLTGHLVLSTLHTNNAPETLTRLLEMGINPLNISDSFLGVLAQRLVRKLCSECVKSFHPSQEEFEDLQNDYGKDAFKKAGFGFNDQFKLHRCSGCEKCSGSGYKGRVGINELIEGTPEIKQLIKKLATSNDLAKQAKKDGMTTLKQDGIQKVIQGITDISEVRRVCVA